MTVPRPHPLFLPLLLALFGVNAAHAGVVASADLRVTKTDRPDPVEAGRLLTYMITVTNAGPDDALNVVLVDAVPANTRLSSFAEGGAWTCAKPPVGGTGTTTCSVPSLAAGAVADFTMVVIVDPFVPDGAVITNTVDVTAATTDPAPGNNSATAMTGVGLASADLSLTKTGTPNPVRDGENITYTITLTNAGPTAADAVFWRDTLPEPTTFVSISAPPPWLCTTPSSGGGSVSCTSSQLAAGTTTVFTLVAQVPPGTPTGTLLTNTTSVRSDSPDPNPGNESATVTTTVNAGANVSGTKAVTGSFHPGGAITYTIVLTNTGVSTQPDNAAHHEFFDILPPTLRLVSASASSGTTAEHFGANTVTWNGSIAPAASETITINARIDPATPPGTTISNQGTINYDANADGMSDTARRTDSTAQPGASDPTVFTVLDTRADLSIAKTDSPDPASAGANLTYTITVTNAGPSNASSVAWSDTLPAGTTFVSVSEPAGWNCTTGSTVACTAPTLAPGSQVFTLVVNVAPGTAAGTVLSNTATVSSTTTDPSPGNESATATTTVIAGADVTGTKTATGTFLPGGSITYTIVLTNTGTGTQQDNPGNELVDALPPQLTLLSATATSGTAVATVATNTVTWNGSIAPSASVTITINATIHATVTPGTTVTNQGTINYDADGNGTNDASRTTAPAAIVVAPASHEQIPTLDEYALMGLALMLAMLAVMVMKR